MSLPETKLELHAVIDDADVEALPPGTKLLGGQYSIVRYLSSGGFGITYLAEDSLNRHVVIKECFPEALCCRRANKSVTARSSTHTGEFQALVDMFVREARNVAKLRHSNIVGVHQVFEDNHTAYMALDLIEGRDLLEILETGIDKLRPDVVVPLLRQLLDAIGTVHAQDMLHRDISPDNILVEDSGRAVLIDFGAAREHASKKSRAISALLVVKDGYSPQEFYISGSQQGPCSDLYSLAATFYHLVTGKAPTNSQTRLASLARNQSDPYVKIAGNVEGYDDAFLEAIDKAMSVFPDERIQSAADWLAIIDGHQGCKTPRTKPSSTIHISTIVAKLVDEATQALCAEHVKVEQAEAVKSTPVEISIVAAPKRSSLMEEGELWPIEMAALKRPQEPTQPIETQKPPVMAKSRLIRLRIAASLSITTLAFGILQSPEDNFATRIAPDIRNIIEFGAGLSQQFDQWIMATL